MRKKLTKGALLMLVLIMLILVGNQIIIRLFTSFSNKVISEYHELHSLQELKASISTIFITDHIEAYTPPSFSNSMDDIFKAFQDCYEYLNEVHRGKDWMDIENSIEQLKINYESLLNESVEENEIRYQILPGVASIITKVDLLIEETAHEIEIYEVRNRKVRLHGTATVTVFGTILILFLTIGSFRFIKVITRPIKELVDTTQRIADGNNTIRAGVNSNDEFRDLANSFNIMLDKLNETTVSEEYLHNIINNLYGALLVTDKQAIIRSINVTTSNLLTYDSDELIDHSIIKLFNENALGPYVVGQESPDLDKLAGRISKMSEMLSREGKLIPVYVTCTVLKDEKGDYNGMVVVGHDLSEEKESERKLEHVRKEKLIAINDAQEQERIRIANDIHDGLGQMLTGISFSIQELSDACQVEEVLVEKLHDQVDATIQEAKNIAHDLTPIVLRDFGLIAAIQNLVHKTNQLNEVEIIFNAYDFKDRVDSKLEKAIYRICQEALNNIMKHSKAKSASLELFREYKAIALVVEDDGVGFDAEEKLFGEDGGGIGLASMKERVDAFNGVFTLDSKRGEGTEIVVELPCRKKV